MTPLEEAIARARVLHATIVGCFAFSGERREDLRVTVPLEDLGAILDAAQAHASSIREATKGR